jgi:O-acetyl-ADP-ribose deacetylase (regulator of RNase III)
MQQMARYRAVFDRIDLLQADITTLDVDAIVNAANTSLLGGGGVDGAIHRAAGPRLLEATRKLGGCPTGEAKITPGFDLPARYSLALAQAHDVRTIAFPAISTGVYGFPMKRAARIAIREVAAGLASNPLITRAVFALRGDNAFRIHRNTLSEIEAEMR